MGAQGEHSSDRLVSRVDQPHRPGGGRAQPAGDPCPAATAPEPDAVVPQLQLQLGQLADYLWRQKRRLEWRERELAARMMGWQQLRRGPSDTSAADEPSAEFPRYPAPADLLWDNAAWRHRLRFASWSGLDLERHTK